MSGAALARSQALIATRALLAALPGPAWPGLALEDAGTVWRTAHQRGPAHLPVDLGARTEGRGRPGG
ncbi:hypothetical protein [Streptomyces sp. NPDC001678]|uniref:hypothetical protein n=1 Tax=Streptomyces sp. NPDC001678 TaxID=3364599 RepID=UPI0036CE1480